MSHSDRTGPIFSLPQDDGDESMGEMLARSDGDVALFTDFHNGAVDEDGNPTLGYLSGNNETGMRQLPDEIAQNPPRQMCTICKAVPRDTYFQPCKHVDRRSMSVSNNLS